MEFEYMRAVRLGRELPEMPTVPVVHSIKPHCKPVIRDGAIVGWREYRRGVFGQLSFVRYHWR